MRPISKHIVKVPSRRELQCHQWSHIRKHANCQIQNSFQNEDSGKYFYQIFPTLPRVAKNYVSVLNLLPL